MKAKVATLGLALGLVASSAFASNTGFKLNYTIRYVANKSSSNFVSPPYFFYPDQVVGTQAQTALSFCKDANDLNPSDPVSAPKVTQILKYNVNTDTYIPQSCIGKVSSFDLAPGEAYVLKPANKADQTVNVVGSHDDSYAWNKLNTKTVTVRYVANKSSSNYVSIPYHVQVNDALALCKDVNHLPFGPTDPTGAPLVTQILKYNVDTDTFIPQSCIGKVSSFNVVPGEGYVMKPANKADQLISFTVY